MEKSRLFICGDSWVDYGNPPLEKRWVGYLGNHYEIYPLGLADMDNVSIIYQLGKIPPFQIGDRLIVVFTDPARYFRRYMIDEFEKSINWYDKKIKRHNDFGDKVIKQKYIDNELWESDMRNDEINFYKKLKELLSDYRPIFVTWNEMFAQKTKDFVHLIQVSSLKDEGLGEDSHPGIVGNYDFYKKVCYYLDETINPVSFKMN